MLIIYSFLYHIIEYAFGNKAGSRYGAECRDM